MIDLLISIYVLSLLGGLGSYMFIISKMSNDDLIEICNSDKNSQWLLDTFGLPIVVFIMGCLFFIPLINTYLAVYLISQLMYNNGN